MANTNRTGRTSNSSKPASVRDKLIVLRLTAAERSKLRTAAIKHGCSSVSHYLRQLCGFKAQVG